MKTRVLPGNSPMAAGVIADRVDSKALKRAIAEGADLLELRVDTFKDLDPEALEKDIRAVRGRLPLLITVRSVKEGGVNRIPDKKRLEIFNALMPFADMVDIELSSGKILKNVIDSARRQGKKVIVSYHDFKSTPGLKILQDIIKKARNSGADFVKIAAFAKSREDVKRLARILTDHEGLIVIAMGEASKGSRVFFPMLGSLVTYGSITAATAPGQMTLKEIKREFRFFGIRRSCFDG